MKYFKLAAKPEEMDIRFFNFVCLRIVNKTKKLDQSLWEHFFLTMKYKVIGMDTEPTFLNPTNFQV